MLPTPRYDIGQTVFVAHEDRTQKRLPCPDCNGSGTWTAQSAAGQMFRINCLRCTGYLDRNMPSLTRQVITVSVQPLTVGSVRIDTAAREDDRVVEYMCRETGVGSGRIYRESELYATEAEARAAAEALRVKHQADLDSEPEAMLAERFAALPLSDARLEAWRHDNYHAWAKARDMREAIDTVLEREDSHIEDADRETLEDAIEDRSWRVPHPLDSLLAHLQMMLDGPASPETVAAVRADIRALTAPEAK